MGLAASAARVGDIVCVLHGSKVPVILREVEQGIGRWKVVSQSYLERWMYEIDGTRDVWCDHEDADSFLLV